MLVFQPVNRGGGELRQCAQHGGPGGRITHDLETQSAFLRDEERFYRPVLTVLLRPANTPVLQPDQRLETVWAFLDRTQLLPTDAWQIDDGCYAFR